MQRLARRLVRTIARVWRMPRRRKLLIAEGLLRVVLAWALVRLVPFRRWRHRLGEPGDRLQLQAIAQTDAGLVQDIAWAHLWIERLFAPRFTCLMLALSARGMLCWHGLPYRLVLGVRRGEIGEKAALVPPDQLLAHAWVYSGEWPIIGVAGSEHYAPVAIYESERNR